MSERVVGLVPPGDARVRIQHGLDTESPIFQVIDTETKTYVMPSVTIEGPDSVVVQFAKTPGVGTVPVGGHLMTVTTIMIVLATILFVLTCVSMALVGYIERWEDRW